MARAILSSKRKQRRQSQVEPVEDVVNVPARTDLMRGRFEKGYSDKIGELVSEMGKQISSSMEAN